MINHFTFFILAPILLTLTAMSEAATAQVSDPGQPEQIAENPEIIVIAEKAKRVRIKFNIDDRTRAVRCKAVRSSGDKEFDKAMCEPVRRCARVEPFNAEMVNQCLARTRREVIEEWVATHHRQ